MTFFIAFADVIQEDRGIPPGSWLDSPSCFLLCTAEPICLLEPLLLPSCFEPAFGKSVPAAPATVAARMRQCEDEESAFLRME